MGKKTYRVYKNGGEPGKVINPTAQFLAKAQAGMQQPSEEEMMMMQQQQQQQQQPQQQSEEEELMQLIEMYAQINASSPEQVPNLVEQIVQELQNVQPEEQNQMIQEMSQTVEQHTQQSQVPQEQVPQEDAPIPVGKNGYIKQRVAELKKANEGLETEEELSQTPTVFDIPDGREAMGQNFKKALTNNVADAKLEEQAAREYEENQAGNLEIAKYGRGKAKRQEKRGDRQAVRQIDRESDMYSRPDRRLLRRGLRDNRNFDQGFTREEMLRGDNVLGKAGYPNMDPSGSTPIQSEEELLYTPEQVFDMLPYNTATPQEQVVTEQNEGVKESIEEGVTQPNGDPYEYKNEDGVLYTRKKGSDKWIKVDPESEAGVSIRKNVYDEEGLDSSESKKKKSKSPSLKEIQDVKKKIGLPTIENIINRNAVEAYFGGGPSADDGNATKEEIDALYASMGKQNPTQTGPASPENLAKPSGRLDMLDKEIIAATILGTSPAAGPLKSFLPNWAPTGSSVPSFISSGARAVLPKGQTMLNSGQKVLGQGQNLLSQGQKLIQAPGGAQFKLFEPGGIVDDSMDLPEARLGRQARQARRLNRQMRKFMGNTPAAFGMNQFGIPSSGINIVSPFGLGNQISEDGTTGNEKGDLTKIPGTNIHTRVKRGLFGRIKEWEQEVNLPGFGFNTGFNNMFGAQGSGYQSGINYTDPIIINAQNNNQTETLTEAEIEQEDRNQNKGKGTVSGKNNSRKNYSKGTGSTNWNNLNRFIARNGIRGEYVNPDGSPYLPTTFKNRNSPSSLPDNFDPRDPSGFKKKVENMGYNIQMPNIAPGLIMDPSRPINSSDLVVGGPAINPLLMPTGIASGLMSQGINLGSKLLGAGSSAPKALNSGQQMLNSGQQMLNTGRGQQMLNAGQRMLNSGQKLLNPPGGTQFSFGFQPGGFVDSDDEEYGNPDLYNFVYGGIDQNDVDYFNSEDTTDPYTAQFGKTVQRSSGNQSYKDNWDPRYATPTQGSNQAQMMQNYMQSMGNNNGQQSRDASGRIIQRDDYGGNYGQQQTGRDRRIHQQARMGTGPFAQGYNNQYFGNYRQGANNPTNNFNNVYPTGNSNKIWNPKGQYWKQTQFPGGPVNMNNLTNAKFTNKNRPFGFGSKGTAEFTWGNSKEAVKERLANGARSNMKEGQGSMIEGPAGQSEAGSNYMTNRQFTRDQKNNNPNMSGRDKRELRRQLNKGQTTQEEYLDRMNNTAPGNETPKEIPTEDNFNERLYVENEDELTRLIPEAQNFDPGMPPPPASSASNNNNAVPSWVNGSLDPNMSGNVSPFLSPESMPYMPAGQIQTGGYDAPTGPSSDSGSASSDSYADGVYDYGERNDPNSNLVKQYKDNGEPVEYIDGVGYQKGGEYEEGGEYDLTEAEIGMIMQAGGMVEFI